VGTIYPFLYSFSFSVLTVVYFVDSIVYYISLMILFYIIEWKGVQRLKYEGWYTSLPRLQYPDNCGVLLYGFVMSFHICTIYRNAGMHMWAGDDFEHVLRDHISYQMTWGKKSNDMQDECDVFQYDF